MAMQVPQYWAEAWVREKFGRGHASGRRSLTVRRFGWSDDSLAQAQVMADARARQAFDRILAGEALSRNEPRVPYDAEGLPIREQIVERDGDVVITRNSYGARCLNSADVLFADVDFDAPQSGWRMRYFWIALAAGIASGYFVRGWVGLLVFLASLWLFARIARWISLRRHRSEGGGPEVRALGPIKTFIATNPDWHLRVYRTPNGYRLLAMHRTFDPLDPQVPAFFQAIGADSYYALLCKHQQCFRARVSAKPWRIGMRERMPPRRGVWPIEPERMPERERWVADYERKAEAYASCRFIEALGSRDYVSATRAVQQIHDTMCRAETTLPLA